MNNSLMAVNDTDVIVVGSGLAGLACALELAPRPVTLISKTRTLAGGSSLWAQGGIAAAIGPDDSPAGHAADTVLAGAGLCDAERVRHLTEDTVENLRWLTERGVPFDRSGNGAFALAREAAHRAPRVLHAGGDATGQVLVQSLIEYISKTPSIDVLTDTFVHEIVVDNGRVCGLLAVNAAGGWTLHRAPNIVLATGGIGTVWLDTTNPAEATGDGLAMAARAGATLADLEFMQFHPTVLAVGAANDGASLPLLTEALRGAGAVLIDDDGTRFMQDVHPSAELAPRDVVARAIHQRTRTGQGVYLDLRPVVSAGLAASFPQALASARKAGFDPTREPLPVVPAAHYHMGGVQTDERGRTSLAGLWACGEVAATGVHGANRLASNSLLEALVYARRVAADIQDSVVPGSDGKATAQASARTPAHSAREEIVVIADTSRKLMSRQVGILRSGVELQGSCAELSCLEKRLSEIRMQHGWNGQADYAMARLWGEARNRLLVARLVALAALRREESRGAHHRDDFPTTRATWQHRQAITANALAEAH